MPELVLGVLVQDIIVTIIALGAIWMVFRRVFAFLRPKAAGEHPCGACGSTSAGSCATRTEAPAPGAVMPLRLVRPDRSRH